MTMGTTPSCPETGTLPIGEPAMAAGTADRAGVRGEANRWWARRYVESGQYLWSVQHVPVTAGGVLGELTARRPDAQDPIRTVVGPGAPCGKR